MKTPEEIKKGLECCVCRYEDHMLKSCTSKCPYFHEGNFCKNVLHRDSLAYIQQLEAQVPKWISVDERLPDSSGVYLTVINCPKGLWIENNDFDLLEERWEHSMGNYKEESTAFVTHWMPLPEPPKED